ncbi:MAG: SDR family NAD(P)-dependent oxidoreductase [Gammaproteobacteria bacterium]|nr:SDR family NAD(P)-dependent oxidoreductase [Gammaproteobacteria bacterium]
MAYFITGISSGLGLSLSNQIMGSGQHVYGVSRRGHPQEPKSPYLHESKLDLLDLNSIPGTLAELLKEPTTIDVAILNAGILGDISRMSDTSVAQLERIMTVNVWANKIIMDWFLQNPVQVDQLILISSGAAVNGGKGWSGYSLSKAALNMLAQLYAHELSATHVISLAPGLVDTAMQEFISNPGNIDTNEFPSFQQLRDARQGGSMPTAPEAAARIISILPELKKFDSGSFIDIRDLL